jgi:hypothetical protein
LAHEQQKYDCPSAQPDMDAARVFAMLSDEQPQAQVAYLQPGARIPQSVLDQLGVPATTRLFRYAAVCEEHRCSHFEGGSCRLGERVASQLEPVVDVLPPCQIRASCRWFNERGGEVCLRCPQIVTRVPEDDPLAGIAATSVVAR